MACSNEQHTPASGLAVHQLHVKSVFDALEHRDDKKYAHHMARASWHGSRIIMEQVSTESPAIFDFIMELHRACAGKKWHEVFVNEEVTREEVDALLEYAGMFLCGLGNYYGEGDQKFVPDLSEDALRAIASISPKAEALLGSISHALLTIPPSSLGYPSERAASSNYYQSSGSVAITPDEVAMVSRVMQVNGISPENTRVRKTLRDNGEAMFHVLQASVARDDSPRDLGGNMFLERGDHSEQLAKICWHLAKAKEYTSNVKQVSVLSHYIESFESGSLFAFEESQKVWVTDVAARVENSIGFIEPYRDPAGVRAEWVGLVGIADSEEAARLKRLVDSSTTVIRKLPWAVEGVNDGKGPFEKDLFEAPDFTSVHALAVCGSVVFEATNLPNYNYIRETCGFKNIVIANRLSANNNPNLPCHWIDQSELAHFRKTVHIVRSVATAVHELFGHGTGKLLAESAPGVLNYEEKPVSPLTGQVIESHYALGQTWTGVFGKLAATVEECRAILVSEYLMDDKEMLAVFGYTDSTYITAEDLLYTTYVSIGVDGLQALQHFNHQTQTWGQAHYQAHFSILKHLLQDGGGVIEITHDQSAATLTVHVDRDKIISHGKPSLGRYLCRLHIWRCTADYASCREYYEPLCAVDGQYEEWRQIVCSRPSPRWKFVQPNTFLREEIREGGRDEVVELRVYEESNEGIVQSWAERGV